LGMGKVKFLLFVSTSLAALNLILLVILVPKMGIMGAAWAYLGGVVPIPFIMLWAEKQYLHLRNRAGFYAKLYGKLIFTSALFYPIARWAAVKLAAAYRGAGGRSPIFPALLGAGLYR